MSQLDNLRLISFCGISSDIQNQEYKIALPSYFTDQGKEAKYWEFQVTGPDPDVMTRSYVHKKCPQEKMVFHRFDSFLNRLNTMVEFFNTAVQVNGEQTNQFTLHIICFLLNLSLGLKVELHFPQFLKLEKVEIGGIRGKALTSNINKVYEEFRVNSLIILVF